MSSPFVVLGADSVVLPGLWQPQAAAASFGLASEEQPQVWQVHLPSDLGAAQQILAQGAASITTSDALLAESTLRLGAATQAAQRGAAFSVNEAAPEATLSAMLSDEGAASFGLFGSDGGREALWEAASAQFNQFCSDVRTALLTYAAVETRSGGALIGRAVVSWGGDTRNLVRPTISTAEAVLHQQVLRQAVAARATMVRVVGLVLRGAAIVAGAATGPIGAVRAIPAAWAFVREVLREVRPTQPSGV